MKYFVFLLTLIIAMPAMAADNNNAVCRTLVKHKPADNVIYKGGVDVHGNAVVPADVNAAPMPTPQVVKVPLTIDLAKRVAALQGTGVQMENNMGMVEIHSDGKVMYNGQDWTEPMMTLCGESYAVIEKTAVETTAEAQMAESVEAPVAPEEPAMEPVRKVRTIASTADMNPMMKPRDPVSKAVDIKEATVRPATQPNVQRVSKPDLKMVEQVRPVEAKEPMDILPEKDSSRVIFNDPNSAVVTDADRIDGSDYR